MKFLFWYRITDIVRKRRRYSLGANSFANKLQKSATNASKSGLLVSQSKSSVKSAEFQKKKKFELMFLNLFQSCLEILKKMFWDKTNFIFQYRLCIILTG